MHNNNLPLAAAKVDAAHAANPSRGARTTTTTAPYTGQWTRKEAAHLLKRTMFGAVKADIDQMLTMTVSQAVDALLNNTTTAPSPPVNNYNAASPDPNIALGSTWVNDTSNGSGTINSYRKNLQCRSQRFRSAL